METLVGVSGRTKIRKEIMIHSSSSIHLQGSCTERVP